MCKPAVVNGAGRLPWSTGRALLLLWTLSITASADWIRDFSAEASYDDNVTRSRVEENSRDDFIFQEQAHFGRYDEIADRLLFAFTLDGNKRNFLRYADFSNSTLGATASLRYRFGLGTMVPFIRVEASGGYTFFEQKVLAHPILPTKAEEIGQDGGWGRGQVTLGKRLTERLAVEASYVYYHFEGPIRVFQRSSNSFLLTGFYDLTSTTRITGSYELADGEVVSYNVPPLAGEVGFPSPIVPLTNAILKGVDTFGAGRAPNGVLRLYNAYNFHAVTHTFALGISQGLTKSISLNLRYERNETFRDPVHYTDNQVRASVHASF